MSNTLAETISHFAASGVYSQKELAHIVGVTPAAFSQWANGHTLPSPDNLRSLIRVSSEDSRLLRVHEALCRLLELPLRTVAPDAPRGAGATLRHYLLRSEYDSFLRLLKTLPPQAQVAVLDEATKRCRELLQPSQPLREVLPQPTPEVGEGVLAISGEDSDPVPQPLPAFLERRTPDERDFMRTVRTRGSVMEMVGEPIRSRGRATETACEL